MRRHLYLALLVLSQAFTVTAVTPPPPSTSRYLEEHCAKCHDSENKKGNLDLSTLSYELNSAENLRGWQDIFDRVLEGEMPPPKKTQPKAAEKTQFLQALSIDLKNANLAQRATFGRVQARRLTRSEFERSVQDLLAVYIPLQHKLPTDPLTSGFTTVAEGQQISPNQMQAYLDVVEEALETAFRQALTPSSPWKKTFTWEMLAHTNKPGDRGPEGRPKQQDIVAWTGTVPFYGRMEATAVPETGWYRIHFKASGVNAPKGEHICASVVSGILLPTDPIMNWIGSIEGGEQVADYEFFSWIEAHHILQVIPGDNTLKKVSGHKWKFSNQNYENLDGLDFPGIAIRSIEMERVYPGFSPGDSRKALFGSLAPESTGVPELKKEQGKANAGKKIAAVPGPRIVSKSPRSDLLKLIQDFACRAFRRPVTAEETKEYLRLAEVKFSEGSDFLEALRIAYRAILTSPRFLYFDETPGPLDNYALATRLSYFLWSSTPDAQLRALADAGKLRNPEVLHAQVERMLGHGNAARFIRNFTDQWLKLGEIDATDPDHKLYGEFDDCLRSAMLEETRAYFRDMIEGDVSVKQIVDSNYTFVNNRLAKHYGISPLPAAGLQRVSLTPEQHRGGLITQASVLKVTANGTSTSPVLRGVWLMERIMGQTIPPPPPNVAGVEPDIRGALTIREQLDKHRTQEVCAGCHTKIDPAGFALENYDVIGGWRQHYRGGSKKAEQSGKAPKIDPSYKMTDGTSFADIQGFKQHLLKSPDQLARNLTRQLVTYSTGAPPTFADRETIETIVAAAKPKDYGVRSLIHQVIQSPIFINK